MLYAKLALLVPPQAVCLRPLPPSITGSATLLFTLAEEGLVEEKHVQGDDQRHYHYGHRSGQAMVDQRAHHLAVTAEGQERDEREGDAEGEHNLTDDQRTAGVDANGEDD